jgi:hypothetical protein
MEAGTCKRQYRESMVNVTQFTAIQILHQKSFLNSRSTLEKKLFLVQEKYILGWCMGGNFIHL